MTFYRTVLRRALASIAGAVSAATIMSTAPLAVPALIIPPATFLADTAWGGIGLHCSIEDNTGKVQTPASSRVDGPPPGCEPAAGFSPNGFAFASTSNGPTLSALGAVVKDSSHDGSAESGATIAFLFAAETIGPHPIGVTVPVDIREHLSMQVRVLPSPLLSSTASASVRIDAGPLEGFESSVSCELQVGGAIVCDPSPTRDTFLVTTIELDADAIYLGDIILVGNASGSAFANGFVDPEIFIDPAFPFADDFQLVFSPNLFTAASAVPEPSSLLLLIAGLVGVVFAAPALALGRVGRVIRLWTSYASEGRWRSLNRLSMRVLPPAAYDGRRRPGEKEQPMTPRTPRRV